MADSPSVDRSSADSTTGRSDGRRSFLATVIGAIVGIVPALAGLAVFFDPLTRKADGGKWVKVASLDAIPTDGRPVRLAVITERRDAWNYYPPEPIGSVFLRRTSADQTPVAFTTVCPHLGCSVDYKPSQGCYLCPCHNSQFNLDGARTDPDESPSPRDLDDIAVEVRDGEVWVDYRNFKGGVTKKIEE